MSNRCRAEKQPRPFPHRQRAQELEKLRCISPSMPVVVRLEWRLVILLTRCCCSFCEQPLRILVPRSLPLPPPTPRRESGMVSSMRTCHCHSSGDGSRSVRAEGGEGRLHPCLPLQCGGCCCSEATPGRPFHSSSVTFSTKTPRGPPRLWRWMASLVYPWVRYERATFQRSRRSRADACPPADRSEAITVQADVTWLPQ